MRNLFLVIAVVAMLPVSLAAAEQPQTQKSRAPTASGRQLPPKGAGNSCAVFGPGFVKAPGTDTCVKIGGAVGLEAGGSR